MSGAPYRSLASVPEDPPAVMTLLARTRLRRGSASPSGRDGADQAPPQGRIFLHYAVSLSLACVVAVGVLAFIIVVPESVRSVVIRAIWSVAG